MHQSYSTHARGSTHRCSAAAVSSTWLTAHTEGVSSWCRTSPPLRVAGITIADTYTLTEFPGDQVAALWGTLDVCARAEQQQQRRQSAQRATQKQQHQQQQKQTDHEQEQIHTNPIIANGESIRRTNTYNTNSRQSWDLPAALMTVEIDAYFKHVRYTDGANTPIIDPLTTRYEDLLPSLRVLNITGNRYDESDALGPFAALATQLQALLLRHCAVTSLQGLGEVGCCESLRKVDLNGCRHLSSLKGLEYLCALEEVDASVTAISSLEPLRTCPALRKVECSGCAHLASLEGLEDHQRLEEVDASYTPIPSIEPLRMCPALARVYLVDCRHLPATEISLPQTNIEIKTEWVLV